MPAGLALGGWLGLRDSRGRAMSLSCCLSSLCSSGRGRIRIRLIRSVNRICCSGLVRVLLSFVCSFGLVMIGASSILMLKTAPLWWLVLVNTHPTCAFGRVALSYPRPVLFPPSCRSIGYPVMIRASGHDTPHLGSWWRDRL